MNLIKTIKGLLSSPSPEQYHNSSARSRVMWLEKVQGERVNTFDIDGVIFINKDLGGIYPGPNDAIITGRSFEEAPETYKMLQERGIFNYVFFNDLKFKDKTRRSSGQHKARTLNYLLLKGVNVGVHFEDDPVQVMEIRRGCPRARVVHVYHNLTTLENVRHT